ncbi:MAG: hypothetical protein JAZ12_12795 [Candidatus Thiodiazotropha taylori]|nr:hypothetical protein [Candidatus Thiodiazotropha taylori]
MTPREFFPRMPEEVFDMWLNPFIKNIGWPFKSRHEDISRTRWKYLLGIDRTLNDWVLCNWRLEEINISEKKLSPGSANMIQSIITHCTTGVLTETANLENTNERFRSCVEFIVAHSRIPLPIVAIINKRQFKVIDGHHRVAALVHIGIPQNYKIPAWVPEFHEP